MQETFCSWSDRSALRYVTVHSLEKVVVNCKNGQQTIFFSLFTVSLVDCFYSTSVELLQNPKFITHYRNTIGHLAAKTFPLRCWQTTVQIKKKSISDLVYNSNKLDHTLLT